MMLMMKKYMMNEVSDEIKNYMNDVSDEIKKIT